jgi:hypothetical protein
MAKNQKTGNVALIGGATDVKAVELLKKIQALREQRQVIETTPFKCPGLRLRGVEVENCRDLELLIKMAADVTMSVENYERSATETLRLAKYPVHKIEGYSAEHVLADVRLAVALTTQVEQNTIIEKMEAIAAKYMTPEDERQRDFETLQNLHAAFNGLENNFAALGE